jgi:hypothetical protein
MTKNLQLNDKTKILKYNYVQVKNINCFFIKKLVDYSVLFAWVTLLVKYYIRKLKVVS